jgi:hypothetical protein
MRSRAPAKQSGSFAKLASMRQASSLVHGSDDEMERKVLEETQFKFLRSIDTPTVCNLIEIVAPECRGAGYTASHLHCPFPELPPMVGFANTVTIRSRDPVSGPSYMQKRILLELGEQLARAQPEPARMLRWVDEVWEMYAAEVRRREMWPEDMAEWTWREAAAYCAARECGRA